MSKFLPYFAKKPAWAVFFLACLFIAVRLTAAPATDEPLKLGDLQAQFQEPPASARPWVYWFWLNGNISSNGITADLEAMKRVGVGGVLIMEVDQGAPVGPVDFMSQRWRDLFKHVVAEARRLGLEVNMNNDAGWNGSGGPWIKPEQSMQKLVWFATNVTGPLQFESTLPEPEKVAGFYKDVAVLAFPTVGDYRIPNIKHKAGFDSSPVGPAPATNLPASMIIDRKQIADVSSHMDSGGYLTWTVPEGRWTIMRFGHTCTGVENAPAPKTGRGLECDKLSPEGIQANFDGMVGKLVADNGVKPGKKKSSFTATHIDSWENGSQNWTPAMRQLFYARRNYDLISYLPVYSGRVVDSLDVSERFLWDLRKTISDLVIENYAGGMRELARTNGLRFTIEAYGSPCDFLRYGGQADEPMGEFWSPGGGAMETCRGMASAGHVYGKRIIGAEAFTAGDGERWREHPASLKVLGDQAFCQGINRFVFHRYALQPWEREYRPGMTMGPWGQHYERTQTWWEQTRPWHDYLARCQFLLRQGWFGADVCYLQAESSPQHFGSHTLTGFSWDECGADVVLERMTVKDGWILLPDGMSYRLLVLPDTEIMSIPLLNKIKAMVEAGATILGAPPAHAPGLFRYPFTDEELQKTTKALWADCDGVNRKERRYGQGRLFRGVTPEQVFAQSGVAPDFTSSRKLNWLHRRAEKLDIYFVANPFRQPITASATFRISGAAPQLWWPETGRVEPAVVYSESTAGTTVGLNLGPTESVFVVFGPKPPGPTPAFTALYQGTTLVQGIQATNVAGALDLKIEKAVYGVLDDPKRTRDVRAKLQRIIDEGDTAFAVRRMAEGDDPAYLVVKTLIVDYTVAGKHLTARGTDPETIDLAPAAQVPVPPPPFELLQANNGKWVVQAFKAGSCQLESEAGVRRSYEVPALPEPLELSGPWQARFTPGGGAPPEAVFDRLISWTEHSDPGIKYFSGTAVYRNSFTLSRDFLKPGAVWLDLGQVEVMARVKLNGRGLGVLWKAPYRLDISAQARRGANQLEIEVVNLWPNRMIGDEQLSEDSERNENGTLKQWPAWVLENKSSPAGRVTFTSWRLWKKEDALLPSGLLGPVRVYPAKVVPIEQFK